MFRKALLITTIVGACATEAEAPTQPQKPEAVLAMLTTPAPKHTPNQTIPLSERTQIDIAELVRYTIAEECSDGFYYKAGFKKNTKQGRSWLAPKFEIKCTNPKQAPEGVAQAQMISDIVIEILKEQHPCFDEETKIVVHGTKESIVIDNERSQVELCSGSSTFAKQYRTPTGNFCLSAEPPQTGWEDLSKTLNLRN